MSLDRSLKSANALIRHRNVLTRAERLAKLTEQEKWNDSKSVYGLPKVAHRKMAAVKGPAKEEAAEGAAAAGATPVPAAAGGKAATPAAGAKAAAPAAGAKGAAPAKAAAPAAKKK
jgi:small basic protein (TIGR04137 family)